MPSVEDERIKRISYPVFRIQSEESFAEFYGGETLGGVGVCPMKETGSDLIYSFGGDIIIRL